MPDPVTKEEMRNALMGMYWCRDDLSFQIPSIGDAKKAAKVFEKNLVEITWNCMSSLEKNPTTLPQTATILKGQSVAGISIDDLMQVKNYGDAAKVMVKMVESGEFDLNEETCCRIHALSGREDALDWGMFRYVNVSIRGVGYEPPHFADLQDIARKGFAFLKERIEDPKERAIAAFLFMSRAQFFFDANKRTASIVMNGMLLRAGFFPIAVLNRDSEEFHERLGEFYESGDATQMMKFFEKSVQDLYDPPRQNVIEE